MLLTTALEFKAAAKAVEVDADTDLAGYPNSTEYWSEEDASAGSAYEASLKLTPLIKL